MSQGMPNDSDLVNFRVVSEEEYRVNLKRAEEAQAQLDHFRAMNETAKKAYDKQQELLRKIQEGKEAERQLQSLKGTSGSAPLALAGPPGQTNTPPTRWWHPPNAHAQQEYGPSYHRTQMAHQTSGSSHSRQYGDTLSFSHYMPVQQPQISQPVYAQNHAQSQQNYASRSPMTHPSCQQVQVQQGRQALPMRPVVSAPQSHQVQAVSRSPPVVSHNLSVQHSGQSHLHAQSGQGSTIPIPNFVTPYRVQQHPALPPSASSFERELDASNTAKVNAAKAFQTAPPTAVPLPKVPTKANETELGATAAQVQAHLNKTPSQSNPVGVPPSTQGSSQQVDLPADVTDSWQRFSQSVVSWAKTAPPQSEMPLFNTRFKVVKDANSQVFITIPGTEGLNPVTLPLQTLVDTLLFRGKKTSPSSQDITLEPSSKSSTEGFRNGYRPYSVPQHQALRTSSGSLENKITSASIARPFTPINSDAAPSSSGRTPLQADRKSLAKDILRALTLPSLKRSLPEERSVMQTPEPSAKRHASGLTSQTSEGLDIPQVPTENIQCPPQAAGTESLKAPKSDQTSVPSPFTDSEPSSMIPSEYVLSQDSNSQSRTALATARQLHRSSLQATPIVLNSQELSENLPADDNDQCSVSKNVFSERPKTPLFLPSPSSSPVAEISDFTQNTLVNLNCIALQRPRQPTRSFYISVPPDPLWLQQYKVQQSRDKKRRLVGESERESSSGDARGDEETSLSGNFRAEEGDERLIEDEDNDIIDLDPANDLATDEYEREAILLSCSRLREQRCKWNNCRVVLNSTEKLIRHLAYAHQEIFEEFSVCRWQRCGQSAVNWAKLFRHLKGHAIITLQCAYQDCEESFRTPRQLVKHHQAEHRNGSFKPSDTPFSSRLNDPPNASLPLLPSYLMEPIQRPSIKKERHGNLGPWVLRQIAGPVDHEVKRYNAASKLLQSPSRSDKQGYQPYEFLSFPSTNYSSAPSLPSKIRGMENLISGEVSNMVHNGLVLWGPQEDEDEDELSVLSSPLLQLRSDDDATTEEQLDVDRVQIMLEN